MRLPLIAATVILVAGCDGIGPFDDYDYQVKADSVVGPASVPAGAAFTVRIHGYVGPSGCYRFKEFRLDREPGSAEVTIIGHYENALCTQALVFFDEPLTIAPPVTNPFVLRVRQPDKTILTKTIRVE
jgi:hypothetical protein